MDKKASLTVAKRLRAEMGRFVERMEEKLPDAVLQYRLEQEKGKSRQPTLDSAYEGMGLIKPPFSMPLMAKLTDLDPYLAGAVDAVASNVSACEMEIKWGGDGEGDKTQRKELETFFFESNDPKNLMSLQEKLKVCAVDFITLGSWNLEVVSVGKKLIDLVHAPAEFVRVKKGQTGYAMVKDGTETPFALWGEKPDGEHHPILRAIAKRPGHRVYGKPATLPLINTVLMNALRDEKNLKWFDQGLLADLLILAEEGIDKAIKDQIAKDYQNTSDGTQTMYILDGIGKALVKELKRTLEDDSFKDMELSNRQRVLTALRVPPAKVAVYEDANRANTITQDEVFRTEVVKPIQDTFRVRFDHVIKYGFGYEGWKFIVKPYSLKDRKEEAEIDKTYVETGVYSVNDILAKLNLPPVQGGDRRVINTPLGLVDLNTWQIAVADPTKNPELMERLGKMSAADLVMRLIKLREDLKNAA